MEIAKVRFIAEKDRNLVVIENLDADVCVQCGAEYLPSDVDEYVERVVKDALSRKIKPHQEEVYRITA
jgi:YgiT-type zinc finger domain-containing protein